MSSYSVDRQKWADMSIFAQFGNIYSEVGRCVAAYNRGDQERFNAALARATDLFDATAEVWAASTYRLREILAAKYQFLSLFFGKTRSDNWENLEKYFLQFAIAERNGGAK